MMHGARNWEINISLNSDNKYKATTTTYKDKIIWMSTVKNNSTKKNHYVLLYSFVPRLSSSSLLFLRFQVQDASNNFFYNKIKIIIKNFEME